MLIFSYNNVRRSCPGAAAASPKLPPPRALLSRGSFSAPRRRVLFVTCFVRYTTVFCNANVNSFALPACPYG